MALLVAAVWNARVSLPAVMKIGLVFEVAGSYGIAAAELADRTGLDMRGRVMGLSWVAVGPCCSRSSSRPGRAGR